MPNVNSVATELREMEKLLLDVFLVAESRLFPSPSLTLLSHEDQRGQRKSDNTCVVWSRHCFHLPSQFCCSSKSDLVWYGPFCFKGFWKENQVVELCGLITTPELGSARALCVLWGRCSRTAFYLWLLQLHAKFQNKPPSAYAVFFSPQLYAIYLTSCSPFLHAFLQN